MRERREGREGERKMSSERDAKSKGGKRTRRKPCSLDHNATSNSQSKEVGRRVGELVVSSEGQLDGDSQSLRKHKTKPKRNSSQLELSYAFC